METTQDRGRLKGKQAVLLTLLMVASLCGLAFAYLSRQSLDWNQHFAVRPEAPSEKQPVKQDEKPHQAGVLPPSFDVASVDDGGILVAAGRSEAGWIVQLKSKSQILGETKADENNEWVLSFEAPLPPGEHTLSLVAVDPLGKRSVVGERDSLVTVPPRREAAQPTQTPVQVLQASPRTAAPSPAFGLTRAVGQEIGPEGCGSTVVKTSDTLWSIAHHCYGDGTKYTKIFRSNRSSIRRPNLIYPDQRFSVPR